MKKIIMLLLFTSLNWLFGQNIELTLKSYKTAYLKYEPIDISLIIKNNGSEIIQFHGLGTQTEFGYRMKINNSNGDTLNREYGTLTNIPSALYTLMPARKFSLTRDCCGIVNSRILMKGLHVLVIILIQVSFMLIVHLILMQLVF